MEQIHSPPLFWDIHLWSQRKPVMTTSSPFVQAGLTPGRWDMLSSPRDYRSQFSSFANDSTSTGDLFHLTWNECPTPVVHP